MGALPFGGRSLAAIASITVQELLIDAVHEPAGTARHDDARVISSRSYLGLLPYAAATFLAAALLFSLEPMIGKLVLPGLGGAPAVWNTCLLFFQGMLLAGYAYAHYGLNLLGPKRHGILHIALIALSLFVLPPAVGTNDPPADSSPVAWLLLTLLRSIGLPFFVLSATAPIVQHWFARTAHPAARDPYFLYAASNLGSLAGLALYPFVLEPLLGLRAQALGWMMAYGAFALLLIPLAWRARQPVAALEQAPARRVTLRVGAKWMAIAFVPSALLLTVTGHITTDVSPMPLLWIAPLALYLATFVAAFGVRSEKPRAVLRTIQPTLTLALAVTVLVSFNPFWMLPLHLVGLTIIAYLAHARLAAERPAAAELTAFYLWISIGGVLGGVFGAIVAPLLLMPELEYALLLTIALLVPGRFSSAPQPGVRTLLIGAAVFAGAAAAAALLGAMMAAYAIGGAGISMLLLRRLDSDRFAVTLVVALVLLLSAVLSRESGETVIARDRNFFGTLRVVRTPIDHRLMHGRTMHGAQIQRSDLITMPTMYYAQRGPLGDVFGTAMAGVPSARIAAVGLGAGTVACYAQPGQQWDMFEINPAVVAIARDPQLFQFLSRCTPDASYIVADGRRALQSMAAARYDLIVLDAFSSDAIPAHLLTREAFALYFERLTPGGIIAVHVSNRYLELEPVVAANAAALAAAALIRDDAAGKDVPYAASTWIALAADSPRLKTLSQRPGWKTLTPTPGFRAWTDDYTNLLSVVRALR